MTVIEEHTETWGPQVGRKHNNPSYDTPTVSHGVTYRWQCPVCAQTSWATFPTREEADRYLARHLDDYCPGDGSGAPFGAWGPDDTYDTDGEGL